MTVDELADKYETKRSGLTLDEALEAAVLGYHVTSPSIQRDAYIHYEFDGWRIQFVHNGRLGSSSGWLPERGDQLAEWSIVPDPSEVKRDDWGRPKQTNIIAQMGGESPPPNKHELADNARKLAQSKRDDRVVIVRDGWGRPIVP